VIRFAEIGYPTIQGSSVHRSNANARKSDNTVISSGQAVAKGTFVSLLPVPIG
jgi:hypothetical protein